MNGGQLVFNNRRITSLTQAVVSHLPPSRSWPERRFIASRVELSGLQWTNDLVMTEDDAGRQRLCTHEFE